MDPITTSIIISFCTGILANYSTDAIKQFFGKAIELEPKLEDQIKLARTMHDVEQVFRQATGVIDACAGTDSLGIDGGLLDALKGIRFDHSQGVITIDNATIKAPVIQYGGNVASAGQTTITNSQSSTTGTLINVSGGAIISMTGNAKITQT